MSTSNGFRYQSHNTTVLTEMYIKLMLGQNPHLR